VYAFGLGVDPIWASQLERLTFEKCACVLLVDREGACRYRKRCDEHQRQHDEHWRSWRLAEWWNTTLEEAVEVDRRERGAR